MCTTSIIHGDLVFNRPCTLSFIIPPSSDLAHCAESSWHWDDEETLKTWLPCIRFLVTPVCALGTLL